MGAVLDVAKQRSNIDLQPFDLMRGEDGEATQQSDQNVLMGSAPVLGQFDPVVCVK